MTIKVTVKPNSRQNKVEPVSEGVYKVFVTASPHEGRANAALIRLLAGFLGIPQGKISIKSGQKSKNKLVIISG